MLARCWSGGSDLRLRAARPRTGVQGDCHWIPLTDLREARCIRGARHRNGARCLAKARSIGQCVCAEPHFDLATKTLQATCLWQAAPLPIGAEVDEGLVRHDDVRPILEAKVPSAIEGLDLQ